MQTDCSVANKRQLNVAILTTDELLDAEPMYQPVSLLNARTRCDSWRTCLGPNRAPDRLEAPWSSGTPTKQTSCPVKSLHSNVNMMFNPIYA